MTAVAPAMPAVAPAASSAVTSASAASSAAAAISAVPAMWAITAVARIVAVEVWLGLRLVGEVATALDHHRACRNRLAFCRRGMGLSWFTAASLRHLGALLLENRLARKPDAVAFHRQHFHQYLIAFL